MRRLVVLPALTLMVACGASKLTRGEAERDIRKDYPVAVLVHVPASASALKGSPEHAKLVALQEQLAQRGWFGVERRPEGDRERFQFTPTKKAPSDLRTLPQGFGIPAAEAEFARATGMTPTRDGARVNYQIRLVRPTSHFELFKALHPDINPGATKERHAVYRREGRAWILQETDEVFKKAE